ncbi:2Fe-2S iron-sulfur cluster-binding protein [Saccharopolyspora rosea]|uniref:2Fe-2S iron-sulfur cluster-binding protein n=1 Tax=Saccharopolyspora rosea TaxID=524884 RepID=A0ABW3FU51_9PSEU|nr:2Fe-2S iron-sulfur cluster-binding protein [Saccharopolyspora rosea]
MPTVTYVSPDGTERSVAVPPGTTVMEAALDNGIDGIVGECGGAAMCATCHVYVESEHLAAAPPMTVDEDAMLDEASSARAGNSRLSCQLPMTAELDGIRVRLPERQR